MKALLFLPLALLLFACGNSSKLATDEGIYWVNSLEKDCVPMGTERCLELQEGPKLEAGAWDLQIEGIEGFIFDEGHLYKVVLRKSLMNPDSIPADAMALRLELVRVLEKLPDPKLRLEGNWVVHTMSGDSLPDDFPAPELEFRLRQNQYLGMDGCNRYTGSIVEVGEKVLRFGVAAGTRMACPEMEHSDRYNQELGSCTHYKIIGEELRLFDDQGSEVLRFHKAL